MIAVLVTVTAAARAADWCGRASGTLPDLVRQTTPNLQLRGEGQLRWFGLLAYRAQLWTTAAPPYAPSTRAVLSPTGPLALEILYARSFRGEHIVSRTIDEMRHIDAGSNAQHERWAAAMTRVFRDVNAGDCILGALGPDGSTRFYFNGTPIGVIDDANFGPAFFGIWLSPSTSQPALRRQLLGETR